MFKPKPCHAATQVGTTPSKSLSPTATPPASTPTTISAPFALRRVRKIGPCESLDAFSPQQFDRSHICHHSSFLFTRFHPTHSAAARISQFRRHRACSAFQLRRRLLESCFCHLRSHGLSFLSTRILRTVQRCARTHPWSFFFLGLFLTAFGSAYYHWHPDNSTLVWTASQ